MALPAAQPVAEPRYSGGPNPWWLRFDFIRAVIGAGVFATLTDPAARLLPVFLAHASRDAWQVRAANDTLARESGLSLASVKRGVEGLIMRGLLTRLSSGGGRTVSVYRLNFDALSGRESPDSIRFDAAAEQGGHAAAPADVPGGTAAPLGSYGRHPRGSSFEPAAGSPVSPEQESEEHAPSSACFSEPAQIETPASAASGGGLFDDVALLDALVREFNFETRDARHLLADCGKDAVLRAIENTRFLDSLREIKKSRRACLIAHAKGGWPLDDRLIQARQKAQRQQDTRRDAAARKAAQDAKERKAAEDAARQREAVLALTSERRAALRLRAVARLPHGQAQLLARWREDHPAIINLIHAELIREAKHGD